MKVAKRLKAAYILQGKNAIPLGENIFQYKRTNKFKDLKNKKMVEGKLVEVVEAMASQPVSSSQSNT